MRLLHLPIRLFAPVSRGLNRLFIATAVSAFSAAAAVAAPTTVGVDGILSAGEYLGGTSNGTSVVQWYNDHQSIYGQAANLTTDLHWEISDNAGQVSLNIFFEVPGHARRMIWDNGCDFSVGDSFAQAGCTGLTNALIADGLSAAEVLSALTAYADNHHGHANMSFSTQTGSELFELQRANGSVIFMAHWDRSSVTTGTNYTTHRTSYDWVLANGCTTALCDAWGTTASIELQWTFATVAQAQARLAEIDAMRLHLSDEARGLPDLDNDPVPEPGVLMLLGLAAASLGWSKRRK